MTCFAGLQKDVVYRLSVECPGTFTKADPVGISDHYLGPWDLANKHETLLVSANVRGEHVGLLLVEKKRLTVTHAYLPSESDSAR